MPSTALGSATARAALRSPAFHASYSAWAASCGEPRPVLTGGAEVGTVGGVHFTVVVVEFPVAGSSTLALPFGARLVSVVVQAAVADTRAPVSASALAR